MSTIKIPVLRPLCPVRMAQAERAVREFVRLCDARTEAHRSADESGVRARPTAPALPRRDGGNGIVVDPAVFEAVTGREAGPGHVELLFTRSGAYARRVNGEDIEQLGRLDPEVLARLTVRLSRRPLAV